MAVQLANASYVWLPLVPRPDSSGNYMLINRQRWSPYDYCGYPGQGQCSS